MIELAKASTLVPASIDTVFQYVTNMENYGEWFPGVRAITSENSLPHATIGKTYVETLLLPEGEFELIIEVSQCEPNRLFLTKGSLEAVLPQMTINFSHERENQCWVNVQYHSRNSDLDASSAMIIALREDLGQRLVIGLANLNKIFHKV